jgi:7-keto-8-aminopelargonate synthetase-like enzyme
MRPAKLPTGLDIPPSEDDGTHPHADPDTLDSADSHERPKAETHPSRPPRLTVPPPSRLTLPPPSLLGNGPLSAGFVSRPMTMPPVEMPADPEDVSAEDLLAIQPPPTLRYDELPPELPKYTVRGVPVQDLPEAALTGHVGLFMRSRDRNLLERPNEHYAWCQVRQKAGLWPYCRSFEGAIGTTARSRSEDGVLAEGLNFAAHDYLSLSTHPAVREAAHRAIRDFGTIAGGSPVLVGNTTLSRQLEEEVAKLVGLDHVIPFTSGWTACFSAITALIREHDYVVMDVYSHASLQQGASSATKNIFRFRHCDNESARRQIKRARDTAPDAGILVITETLFSMDSDSPRIAELQDICREHDATLLVDCAHDLGALGPGGTGRLGIEGLVGKVDLLVGCFSKAFATNGGFVATRTEKLRQYIRAYGGAYLFSTGLSPIQTGVALAALRVSASPEGDELRARLMDAAHTLRDELGALGLTHLGEPSALVPVLVGEESVSRIAGALAFERGLLCNLIEYPAVAVRMSRFRLQLQALHTREQVRAAAAIVEECVHAALECGARPAHPVEG